MNVKLYILEQINLETNFNNKVYTLEDYISRLLYIDVMLNNNKHIKIIESIMTSIDIIKIMLLEYVLTQKSNILKQALLNKYEIYFNDIKFINDKENIIHGYIDNTQIKLNITLGYILVTYYKHLIYRDNIINSIIDKLGDIIERRDYCGNVNSRL